MGGLFQLMVLPKASAPARGPSSHQDRQLQPAPAPGSVVLMDPTPPPPGHLSSALGHAPTRAPLNSGTHASVCVACNRRGAARAQCLTDFKLDIELSAAYAPDYMMGAAISSGLHTGNTWSRYTRMYHETAQSHYVCPGAAPTHPVQVMVGGVVNPTCKDIRIAISMSAITRRDLRRPSHTGCMVGLTHRAP